VPTGVPAALQISYINRGSYGSVCKCLDRETGGFVALKYIERGSKVRPRRLGAARLGYQGSGHCC
jgi:hypothetical protein